MSNAALPDGLQKLDKRPVAQQVFDEMAATLKEAPTAGIQAMRHAANSPNPAATREAVNNVFGNLDFSPEPDRLNDLQKVGADEAPKPKRQRAVKKGPKKPKKIKKPKEPKLDKPDAPEDGFASRASKAVSQISDALKKRVESAGHAYDRLADSSPYFEVEVEGGFGKNSEDMHKDARHALDRAKERIHQSVNATDIDRLENLARSVTRPDGDFHIELTMPVSDKLDEAGSRVAGYAQFAYPGTSKKPVLMTVLGHDMKPKGVKVDTAPMLKSAAPVPQQGLSLMRAAGQKMAPLTGAVNKGIASASNVLGKGRNLWNDTAAGMKHTAQRAASSVGNAGRSAASSVGNAGRSAANGVGHVVGRASGMIDSAGRGYSNTVNKGLDAVNRGIANVKNPRLQSMLAKGQGALLRSGPERGMRLANGLVDDAAAFGTIRPGLMDLGIAGVDSVARMAKGDFVGAADNLPTMLQAGWPLLTGTRGHAGRFALDHEMINGASEAYNMFNKTSASLPITPPGKAISSMQQGSAAARAPSMKNPASLAVADKNKTAPMAPKPAGPQMPISPIKVSQLSDGQWMVEGPDETRITADRDGAYKVAASLSGVLQQRSTVDSILDYSRKHADKPMPQAVAPRRADPNAPPVGLGDPYPGTDPGIQMYGGSKHAMPVSLLLKAGKKLLPRVGTAIKNVSKGVASKGIGLAGDISTAMDVKSVANATANGRQSVNAADFRVT